MTTRLNVAVYHNLHSGGAKHTLFEVTRRLATRHRVDLFTLSTADIDFYDVRNHVNQLHVTEFQLRRRLISPFGRLNHTIYLADLQKLEKVSQEVAYLIDRRGYDVVYIHPCQFTKNPSVLSYLKTPTLNHSHEPFRELYEPAIPRPYASNYRRLLDRIDPLVKICHGHLRRTDSRNIRHATLTLTNSFFTREALYRIYGINSFVVYWGVDKDKFRSMNLSRKPFVLSVGALIPAKGFDFIIESLSLMAETIRPELVIVSNYQEPKEYAYLESLAEEKRVRLTMLTMINTEELVRLYNMARATVCAQVLEPFGLVPPESMACGTPVVAVAEGGLRESLTHGYTGLLVNRDQDEFASAVEHILTDLPFAERLGVQGRMEVCEKWTWERAVRQIERYLQLAIQTKSPNLTPNRKCNPPSRILN